MQPYKSSVFDLLWLQCRFMHERRTTGTQERRSFQHNLLGPSPLNLPMCELQDKLFTQFEGEYEESEGSKEEKNCNKIWCNFLQPFSLVVESLQTWAEMPQITRTSARGQHCAQHIIMCLDNVS